MCYTKDVHTSILLPLAKLTCSLTNSTNVSGNVVKVTAIAPLGEAEIATCTDSSCVSDPSRKDTRGVAKPTTAKADK